MNRAMPKGQQGFTLIELVIVVIVLGLLAANAAPRFLEVTEDAEDATVEGVAGGFASAAVLVRAQWELEGRPSQTGGTNQTFVTVTGVQIGVDQDTGYPTGQLINDSSSEDDAITDADCESIFTLIMQSAPTITSDFSQQSTQFQDDRYFATVNENDGGDATTGTYDRCYYYLTQTIKNITTEPNNDLVGNGFIYDPRIGQVTAFSNN